MTGFTKLFGSIVTSTVWQEPHTTVRVWITMMAESDQNGCVYAAVPGLAHLAKVTIPECEAALDTFLSPDPYSRTPDHEGRRIEKIDGGWRLLNHAKYRGMMTRESIRESKRDYMRRVREQAKAGGAGAPPDPDESGTKVEVRGSDIPQWTQAEAEADTSRAKSLVRQAGRFSEFWSEYPVKSGKKPCLAKWKARGLDKHADSIIADVRNRKANDKRWLDGFVPNPLTYLNQDRWEDEVQAPEKKPASAGKFQGRTDHIEAEGKLERELAFIQHLCNLGQYDQAEADKQKAAATEKYRHGKK